MPRHIPQLPKTRPIPPSLPTPTGPNTVFRAPIRHICIFNDETIQRVKDAVRKIENMNIVGGEIDFDNPQLQAFLSELVDRIVSLEERECECPEIHPIPNYRILDILSSIA